MRLLSLILLLYLSIDIPVYAQSAVYTQSKQPDNFVEVCTKIELFSRKGCPHCSKAHVFLGKLKQQHPGISIIEYDVVEDIKYRERFQQLNQQFNVQGSGVPSFLICDHFLVGFDNSDNSGVLIKRLLNLEQKSTLSLENEIIKDDRAVNLPLLGEVSVEGVGLPLFTIILGLVDGFNPCAMWVLLFLLSLLVNLKSRSRILMIAGIFVLTSGLVYFAFMAAWLNIFLIIGFSRVLQLILGALAILIGAVHIKDFFAFKKGLSLSIPETAKPGLYTKVRRVIQAENLFMAIFSVCVVAVLVNFLELLCTAGLPVLYTQILVHKELSQAEYYGYLLLYNLAYIFDDGLMVTIVVVTLNRKKIQEQQGRWLKLLSGSVILILGSLLILMPDWLF